MTREEKVKANKPLADRLKQLRKSKGVTAKQASQDLNNAISCAKLRHIENGYNSANYKDLILLATYYGVTTDWLLGVPGAVAEAPNYGELVRDIRELQKEVDYWHTRASSYEHTILKLSLALTEGKHEDN